MPNFGYIGVTKEGTKKVGKIQATSIKEARKLLRAQGLRPKKITPPSILEFDFNEWILDKGWAAPFTDKDLTHFTRQLSIMINAGIPIIESLEILYKATKQIALKKTIKAVTADVSEGKTISEALQKHKGFTKLYCNLVKAGEAGGILDIILDKITLHMEKQQKIKSQIKSALTYPVIIVFVGIVVVWGMMVFVVPQFVGMLKDTGQEPPFITQLVMDTSKFFGDYTSVMIPMFIIIVFVTKNFIKTTSGKLMFDKLLMKTPLFGGIVIKGSLSSFSRTLATLLSSGVSLIDSMDICIETIDNVVIRKDLLKVKSKIVQGKTLTEPLQKIEYFPEMVGQMIRVGEQTGQIDQMLLKVADVFEEELEELIGSMTKLIEPLIIVVLGSIIAIILVAMYLPIFMSAGGAD